MICLILVAVWYDNDRNANHDETATSSIGALVLPLQYCEKAVGPSAPMAPPYVDYGWEWFQIPSLSFGVVGLVAIHLP
jgi:hypothetical protein